MEDLKAFRSLLVNLLFHKVFPIITIYNKKGAKQLAPLLLIATSSLSKICAQCKDVYSIRESMWSVDYYIYSFYKRCRPNNNENKCPIYTLLKNILSY